MGRRCDSSSVMQLCTSWSFPKWRIVPHPFLQQQKSEGYRVKVRIFRVKYYFILWIRYFSATTAPPGSSPPYTFWLGLDSKPCFSCAWWHTHTHTHWQLKGFFHPIGDPHKQNMRNTTTHPTASESTTGRLPLTCSLKLYEMSGGKLDGGGVQHE